MYQSWYFFWNIKAIVFSSSNGINFFKYRGYNFFKYQGFIYLSCSKITFKWVINFYQFLFSFLAKEVGNIHRYYISRSFLRNKDNFQNFIFYRKSWFFINLFIINHWNVLRQLSQWSHDFVSHMTCSHANHVIYLLAVHIIVIIITVVCQKR